MLVILVVKARVSEMLNFALLAQKEFLISILPFMQSHDLLMLLKVQKTRSDDELIKLQPDTGKDNESLGCLVTAPCYKLISAANEYALSFLLNINIEIMFIQSCKCTSKIMKFFSLNSIKTFLC